MITLSEDDIGFMDVAASIAAISRPVSGTKRHVASRHVSTVHASFPLSSQNLILFNPYQPFLSRISVVLVK